MVRFHCKVVFVTIKLNTDANNTNSFLEIVIRSSQQHVWQGEVSDTELIQLADELDMQLELLENKKNAGAAAARRGQVC
jgi:hypothetical protein